MVAIHSILPLALSDDFALQIAIFDNVVEPLTIQVYSVSQLVYLFYFVIGQQNIKIFGLPSKSTSSNTKCAKFTWPPVQLRRWANRKYTQFAKVFYTN